MIIVRVPNINGEGLERHSYHFLDVVETIWVQFKKDNVGANSDNFIGWDKSQAHTAILRYRGKRIRALPGS